MLGYADDLDLIRRTLPAVESAYQALTKSIKEAGFQVNATKTKYLKASKQLHALPFNITILIGSSAFGWVSEFVYLGSLVMKDNNVSLE